MAKIYMGSMDDRVEAYPWHEHKANSRTYINQIIQNIIIGNKSVINDGYVVNNNSIKEELFYKKDSFFRDIFLTGEIILPGRKLSLNKLIEEQLENNVGTFEPVSDEVGLKLDEIDKILSKKSARIEGPSSMDVWKGFYNLIKSLENRQFDDFGISMFEHVSRKDFETAVEMYIGLPVVNGKPPSRTEWEVILHKLRNEPYKSCRPLLDGFAVNELMRFANEAYHYNFASILGNKIGENIGIETALTPAFSYMLNYGESDLDGKTGDHLLLELPIFNNLMDINSINKLISNEGVGRARIEFIDELEKLEKGTANESALNDLKYKARAYNALLNEEFSSKNKEEAASDATNYVLSMITSEAGLEATLGWLGPAGLTKCLTKIFIKDRSIKIPFGKNNMVSCKIDAHNKQGKKDA